MFRIVEFQKVERIDGGKRGCYGDGEGKSCIEERKTFHNEDHDGD